MCLECVCYCFVEKLCISAHQGRWPVVFFPCGILIWLWFGGGAGFVTRVWGRCPLFSVLEEFEKGCCRSCKHLVQFPSELVSGPGPLCLGRVLVTDSVVSLCFGLFRFSVSSCCRFVVGGVFLGIYFSLLGRPACWHVIVHSNFSQSFEFLWYQLERILFRF